jgi:hypothetical protein
LSRLRHWRILPLYRFVETPTFSRLADQYLTDEESRDLQISLLLRPEQGKLIRGGKGLRKLRCKGFGRGKRGGLRIIYFWKPLDSTCYMLFIYPKNEQGDLTPAQARSLARLVDRELA